MKGITISGHKGKQYYDMTPGPGAYQLASDELKRPCSAKYLSFYTESAKDNVPISEWMIHLVQASTTLTIIPIISLPFRNNPALKTSKVVILVLAVYFNQLRVRNPSYCTKCTPLPNRSKHLQILRMIIFFVDFCILLKTILSIAYYCNLSKKTIKFSITRSLE